MNPDEYSYELKIPKERIAILIGKNGEIKAKLETEANCRVNINSDDCFVRVIGKEAISLFNAREIIKAVGRGFNPDVAFLLLRADFALEIIKLADYNKHKNHMLRMKARVIGTQGKSRKFIEQMTETYVSVYGKTISVLGRNDNVSIGRRAIENLLEGSPHSTVFKWLERQRRELKVREFEGKEKIEIKDEFKELAGK